MFLHLGGALFILGRIASGFNRLLKITRAARPIRSGPAHEQMQRLVRRLELKEDADLLLTDAPVPPMTFWLLRPKVILPGALVEMLSPAELETLLAHELVHHRRNDWAANWLQLLLCAAWWFNPLIWLLNRALRDTREECCDDALLAENLTEPADYCRTLIAAADQMANPPAYTPGVSLGFAEKLHPVANRMMRIMDATLHRAPKLSGPALIVCALLCIAVLPGLRGGENRSPFDRGIPITVRVLDENSQTPISGAQVTARFEKGQSAAMTDAKGVAIVHVGDGTTKFLGIAVKAARFVPAKFIYQSRRSEIPLPKDVTIQLEHGTQVGGIVQGSDGKPIEGASVSIQMPGVSLRDGLLHYQALDEAAKTDKDGRWTFDGAPKDLSRIIFRVAHPDYLSDEHSKWRPRPDPAELRDSRTVFKLEKGLDLAGTVLGHDGQPVIGATVTLAPNIYIFNTYPKTTTDEKGEFRFRHLPPGQTVVTISASGHGPELREFNLQLDTPRQVINLPISRTLEGRVLDDAGKDIAGALVRLVQWRGYSSLEWSAKTDDDGRFSWSNAPADTFTVQAMADGFLVSEVQIIDTGTEELIIAVDHKPRLSGTVVDKQTRDPIARFKIMEGLYRQNRTISWGRPNAATFSDGKFTLDVQHNSRDADFMIRVEADGYLPAISERWTPDQPPPKLDFELVRAPGIHGLVKTPEGAPAQGAQVSLGTSADGITIVQGRISDRASVSTIDTMTDQEGRFSLPPQIEKHAIVILHERGWAWTDAESLQDSSEVTLQPYARIEGHVNLTGQANSRQRVMLLFSGRWNPRDNDIPMMSQQCSATTDENGRFVLERVVPLPFVQQVFLPSPEQWTSVRRSIHLELAPGKTTRLEIGGHGALVRAIVKPGHGRNSWFTLRQFDGGDFIFGEPDPDGKIAMTDVPAGKYTYHYFEYRTHGPRPWVAGVVVVPENGEIDLGELQMNPPLEPEIGQLAPDFRIIDIDGEPIQLSAFRGKYILLAIFSPYLADRESTRAAIGATQTRFKAHPRLTVVTLVNTASSLSLSYQYPYPETPQDRLPGISAAMTASDLATVMVYSPGGTDQIAQKVYLIDPDGKIIAKDLKPDQIEAAVAAALGE